jgi:glutathione S-transferase
VEFVEPEEAKRRGGLRLVVVPGVPSPWGEAAKGILHVKRIPFVAVRLNSADPALVAWIRQDSAPVAMYEDEAPRGGWAEILLLAERLAPEPRLVPADPGQRAELFGLGHEICGEMGLGWCRRLEGVAAGLEGDGSRGFARPVAQYLGPKYGYRLGIGPEAHRRVLDVLGLLAARLREQQRKGSEYYLGDALTALDVYSATFMALFKPLPPDQCPIPELLRSAFESVDEDTARALDPILIDHRDRVYARHLELPLKL